MTLDGVFEDITGGGGLAWEEAKSIAGLRYHNGQRTNASQGKGVPARAVVKATAWRACFEAGIASYPELRRPTSPQRIPKLNVAGSNPSRRLAVQSLREQTLAMRMVLALALLAVSTACSNSPAGRRCGGNTSDSPGPCPTGYSCVNDSGIPSGDIGGVCEKND